MSISGYVRENYNYTVEGVQNQAPITATVTITPNKCEDEIKVPCIVPRIYKLQFSLLLNKELKKQLPANLDPDKITIQFYEGDSEQTATLNENNVTTRKQVIDVKASTITGECLFKVPNFHTTVDNNFLYIALKIHKVVIKYLVCDLAVFTNSSQITKDYELVLAGNHVQAILENCFWHPVATFITKKEADEAKKLQNVADPIPAERKPLHDIVLATEDALAKLKELLHSKKPYNEEQVSQITSMLVSAISKPQVLYETPPESPNIPVSPLAYFPTDFEELFDNYGF